MTHNNRNGNERDGIFEWKIVLTAGVELCRNYGDIERSNPGKMVIKYMIHLCRWLWYGDVRDCKSGEL